MNLDDIIIDRSQDQKRLYVEKLRLELHSMGFSVVPTEWFKSMFWEAKLEKNRRSHETANNSHPHRSQGGGPQVSLS